MSPNAFIGKADPPTEEELTQALGPAMERWNGLLEQIAKEQNITDAQWHSYSKKSGWSLRLRLKQRTILYLIPGEGLATVAFVFGARAVDAIRNGTFPKKVLTLLDEAKRYAEGTGIRLELKTKADIALAGRLAKIKLDN